MRVIKTQGIRESENHHLTALLKILFIYLSLAVLGLGFYTGFCLTAVSESYHLVVAHSLLTTGFSCCRVQALWPPSFRACLPGSIAQVQSWRTSLLAPHMWELPRSGIKSMSPALASRFFTIEPPRKPHLTALNDH